MMYTRKSYPTGIGSRPCASAWERAAARMSLEPMTPVSSIQSGRHAIISRMFPILPLSSADNRRLIMRSNGIRANRDINRNRTNRLVSSIETSRTFFPASDALAEMFCAVADFPMLGRDASTDISGDGVDRRPVCVESDHRVVNESMFGDKKIFRPHNPSDVSHSLVAK